MRRALVILMLVLCVPAAAQNESRGTLFYDYDLDNATDYVYGTLTGLSATPFGSPIRVDVAIKTTGSSTSVTAVTAATSPFAAVAVNDVLAVRRGDGTTDLRRVTARADADNVTVDTAVDWSAGFAFGYYDATYGTAGTSGWTPVAQATRLQLEWHVKQLNVTGGILVRVQCRTNTLDTQPVTVWPDPTSSASTDECKKGTMTAVIDCALIVTGRWDACRLGFKIGTADDGGDTGADAEKISASVTVTRGGAQ